MRNVIESLSLVSGAAVVAVVSVLLTLVLSRYVRGRMVCSLPLGVPLVVSYSLYWSPVWMGANDEAQFGAWAVLFIVPWYLAGAVTSAFVVLLFRHYQKAG